MKEKFYLAGHSPSKAAMERETESARIGGFDADADDDTEGGIDLNQQLVKNKPATFFMRVNSGFMAAEGIHRGDVVIVDRSLEPKNGKIIIAVLDGEMLIRRLEINQNKKRLLPGTKSLSAIEISESSSFMVWGVVTYVIHSL